MKNSIWLDPQRNTIENLFRLAESLPGCILIKCKTYQAMAQQYEERTVGLSLPKVEGFWNTEFGDSIWSVTFTDTNPLPNELKKYDFIINYM